MFQDSISSEVEGELLGSPSSQELAQEIREANAAHQKLLDYSSQDTPLILPTMDSTPTTSQQAHEIPLPPTTPSELWTAEELATLHENRKYFEEMIKIVNKAEKEGVQKLPVKPKRKLEQLFKEKTGVKKSRKDLTTPKDLHEYLKSYESDIEKEISREAFSTDLFNATTDEGDVIERLKRGVRNLKRQDAQSLFICIQFGNFLILCKNWHEQHRKQGTIKKTWAVWLKEQTGYSDVHARKLRILAGTIYGYPKFCAVGLPFSFIYSKLNDIKAMLQVPEFAAHWKQTIHVPRTLELQKSQE